MPHKDKEQSKKDKKKHQDTIYTKKHIRAIENICNNKQKNGTN